MDNNVDKILTRLVDDVQKRRNHGGETIEIDTALYIALRPAEEMPDMVALTKQALDAYYKQKFLSELPASGIITTHRKD